MYGTLLNSKTFREWKSIYNAPLPYPTFGYLYPPLSTTDLATYNTYNVGIHRAVHILVAITYIVGILVL